jgi:hypothetical protein
MPTSYLNEYQSELLQPLLEIKNHIPATINNPMVPAKPSSLWVTPTSQSQREITCPRGVFHSYALPIAFSLAIRTQRRDRRRHNPVSIWGCRCMFLFVKGSHRPKNAKSDLMTNQVFLDCPHCSARRVGMSIRARAANGRNQGIVFATCNVCTEPVSAVFDMTQALLQGWMHPPNSFDVVPNQGGWTLQAVYPSVRNSRAPDHVAEGIAKILSKLKMPEQGGNTIRLGWVCGRPST